MKDSSGSDVLPHSHSQSPSTDTTPTINNLKNAKLTEMHHLNAEEINLENELDWRQRQLQRDGDGIGRKASGEFDVLEKGDDEVFGEDYGWECGIW